MFRKTLAATTTALVAAIFTFGAVAAPAVADDGSDTTAPVSTVTTDAGAAGTESAPSTTTAPAETTPPPAQTAPEAAPAADPAPPATESSAAVSAPPAVAAPPCIPDTLVSYTYDPSDNTGVLTVGDQAGSSGELCTGIYITAVSWQYESASMWPQVLKEANPVNDGQKITKPGRYPFGATPQCGQGDIYATFWGAPVVPHEITAAHAPVEEYFLHDLGYLGITGPNPTYMTTPVSDCVLDSKVVAPKVTAITQCGQQGSISWTDDPIRVTYARTSGNGTSGINQITATAVAPWVFSDNSTTHVFTIDLGTFTACKDVTPGDPSVLPAVCTVGGGQGNGTIFIDQKTGILDYTVTFPDGHSETVTAPSISVPAGTYTVNVTPAPGYQIAGPIVWPLQVTVDAATDCGDLPTDAVLPTSVSSKGATCSTGTGSITVGPTADYLEFIDYFIDGTKVTRTTTAVKPGTHVVTAAVNQTSAPGDTLDNPGPWTITIEAASVACGQLKTLALTGTSPTTPLLAAGILLPAGAALLLGAALIRRRREQ